MRVCGPLPREDLDHRLEGEAVEPGLDPVELGEKVLEGVLRNDLYIIPYSEFREELVARLDRVLAALPDPKDDPGAARRQEVFAARRRERDEQEGRQVDRGH